MENASLEEVKEMCRYLGLTGPDALGVTREEWDTIKVPKSHVVIGADSVSSGAEKDPSDFTFVISPDASPSHFAPSLQDQNGRATLFGFGSERPPGNNVFSTFLTIDADAAVKNETYVEQRRWPTQERVQERQSQRYSTGLRTHPAPLTTTTQSQSFSPSRPNTRVLTGTPRPSCSHRCPRCHTKMLRIFEYPDPAKHTQWAQSQPVTPPCDMPLASTAPRLASEEKVSNRSVIRNNIASLTIPAVRDGENVIAQRSGDPVSGRPSRDDSVVVSRDCDSSSSRSLCCSHSSDLHPPPPTAFRRASSWRRLLRAPGFRITILPRAVN